MQAIHYRNLPVQLGFKQAKMAIFLRPRVRTISNSDRHARFLLQPSKAPCSNSNHGCGERGQDRQVECDG